MGEYNVPIAVLVIVVLWGLVVWLDHVGGPILAP